MSFFGMGAWEITIILVAALVIFGPNRLPEIAGKVGKTVRDLRQMSAELTGEFERTAGVQELKKAVQGELSGIKSEVNSVTSSVKRDLNTAGSTASSAASAAKSTTAAKPTTSASSAKPAATTGASSAKPAAIEPAKASKKDPLADVSFLEEIASTAPPAVNGAAASAKVTQSSKSSTAAIAPSVDQMDALTRARQRRMSAGYNRRPG
jgi:Tat protein translocase TatB subunit